MPSLYRKPNLSPYQFFLETWKGCTKCALGERRKRIALCRGQIPCDALFVGEAPGASEDVLGKPFVGPAGKLLDQQVAKAVANVQENGLEPPRIAFTNLICCIPKWDDVENKPSKSKTGEPPKFAVDACFPRLKEFVWICKPRLLVLVGDHARKRVAGQMDFSNQGSGMDWLWLPEGQFLEFTSIVHPAAILRADIVKRGLMYQRAVVTLTEAFECLQLPF